MSICLDTTTKQNSKYGAAFRKKPIMLKTHAEVRAFLVPLEDLYFNLDGTIGGLPDSISNMINRTTNNAKIEEIRTMLQDIINKKQVYSDAGIPRFTAAFRFENGSLSVADNGFTNDMGLLLEQMSSISSTDNMYAGIYHYQFRNVL